MAKVVRSKWSWVAILAMALVAGVVVPAIVFGVGEDSLTVTPYADVIRFEARGVTTLQVQIFDLSGKKLWDSGIVFGQVVDWGRVNDYGERLAYGTYLYVVQGWNSRGSLVLSKSGKLAWLPGDKLQLQQAPALEPPAAGPSAAPEAPSPSVVSPLWNIVGNYTISGYLGVGTENLSFARITASDGSAPEASAVGIPKEKTIAVYGDGSAYFLGRDVVNNIEYAMGISVMGGAFIGAMTAHDLWFRTNNVNRLTIKADTGNVGIGTTSPAQELHVHGVFPQVMLTNTWNSHWFTMGTGNIGFSLDSDYGREPFCVKYQAPDYSLWVDSDGTVGVGTGSPSAGLHIRKEYGDWELRLTETGTGSADRSVILFDKADPDWALGVNAGTDTFFLWYDPGGADSYDIWSAMRASDGKYWFLVNDNLYVESYCNFQDVDIFGDLWVGGTKNFVVPHPYDPDLAIVYAALEGPEAGTYIRGSAQLVGGEAVVDLPEHFSLVTEPEGLTVQLTPVGEWLQLYVVEKSPSRIIVREASGKSGQFDYLVQGVRKGYADYQVIRSVQTLAAATTRLRERLARGPTAGGAPLGEAPAVVPAKTAEERLNRQ